jgi:hypothetical protein
MEVTTPSPVDMELAICHVIINEVGIIFDISKIHWFGIPPPL